MYAFQTSYKEGNGFVERLDVVYIVVEVVSVTVFDRIFQLVEGILLLDAGLRCGVGRD